MADANKTVVEITSNNVTFIYCGAVDKDNNPNGLGQLFQSVPKVEVPNSGHIQIMKLTGNFQPNGTVTDAEMEWTRRGLRYKFVGTIREYNILQKGKLTRTHDGVTFDGEFNGAQFTKGTYTQTDFSITGNFQKFQYFKSYKSKYLDDSDYVVKKKIADGETVSNIKYQSHDEGTPPTITGVTNHPNWTYKGDYNQDLKLHGKGRLIWHKSGHSYNGDFANGVPCGVGEYFTPTNGAIPVKVEGQNYILTVGV